MPMYRHDAMPFLQAVLVEFRLGDGRFACFSTWQNDDTFPLALDIREQSLIADHWGEPLREGEPSIYRIAPETNLPLGVITGVRTSLDAADDLFQVEIEIDGRPMLLRAGEVIEHGQGRAAACDLAGEILVFPDAANLQRARLNEVIELA